MPSAKTKFYNFWNNYPTENSPCAGDWDNQCAIRMSITRQTGDHIDLWRSGLTQGYNDPANKSASVWFWELS